MVKNVHGWREEWIAVSERILREQPEKLQELLLDIAKKYPEMSFFATDLARLRMAGGEHEKELEQLWQAPSVERIDAIVNSTHQAGDPARRALRFLACLVRTRLDSGTCQEKERPGGGLFH
ncbi:MAG TPA: hypothetical protein ENI89_13325 [Desulfobulbus sp.]|nr:hypothetical protein [Desulfobulbus sp.]